MLHILIAFSSVFATANPPKTTPLTLKEVTANVEAAEKLYQDHDVVFQYHFALEQDPERYQPKIPVGGSSAVVPGANFVLQNQWNAHFVNQGALFRLDRTGSGLSTGKQPPFSNDRVDAFDGATQTVVAQHAFANIRSGNYQPDADCFRPHILMLRSAQIVAPLSLLLAGDAAVRRSTFRKQFRDGQTASSHYEGIEIVDSLVCHKVVIDNFVQEGSSRFGRFELWLAEDRNYIPMHFVSYTYMYSKTLPIAEGRVRRWREVRPGIWCPAETEVTTYDPTALRDRQVQDKYSTESYLIDSINLTPAYPKQYFTNVSIPDGAKVYELDSSGKLVKKYAKGVLGEVRAVRFGWLRAHLFLLVINAVIVAIVACWWLYRRRAVAPSFED